MSVVRLMYKSYNIALTVPMTKVLLYLELSPQKDLSVQHNFNRGCIRPGQSSSLATCTTLCRKKVH